LSGTAILVEGLCVRFGTAEILREVGFRLERGGFLAVIGPNGAGKSTLLRCLDGIVEPSAGRIDICGRPLREFGRRHLARTVSYVPQPDAGLLEYTVRAFVEMGRFPYLGAWAALTETDQAAVAESMDLTEVTEFADRTMASLSGGERQRVSIAAALAQGGTILLLDEPTSFLDYRHQVQILDLLDRLHREKGLTVVVVTHDLNSAVASADSVLALKGGGVEWVGPPSELLDERVLGEIFDARFRLVAGGHHGLPFVLPARNGS
jgi:ABC-type cobalamin/Fe3+-siderophores transport system ATPase subunit